MEDVNKIVINGQEILGIGSFGTVCKGIYKNKVVAVKIINKNYVNKELVLKEFKIMKVKN